MRCGMPLRSKRKKKTREERNSGKKNGKILEYYNIIICTHTRYLISLEISGEIPQDGPFRLKPFPPIIDPAGLDYFAVILQLKLLTLFATLMANVT
jgi:hypothetical protein